MRFPTVQRGYPYYNSSFRQGFFMCVCHLHRFSIANVVSEIQQIVPEYVQCVQDIPFVPSFSYGRGLLRDDGGLNRLFFTFLFRDKASSHARSRLRAKLAIVFGASLTIFKTRT
jgi:hypothetical protein